MGTGSGQGADALTRIHRSETWTHMCCVLRAVCCVLCVEEVAAPLAWWTMHIVLTYAVPIAFCSAAAPIAVAAAAGTVALAGGSGERGGGGGGASRVNTRVLI